MDDVYNNNNSDQNSSTDSFGQAGSDYGNYMPPPPQNNGYGNYPPPQYNGYGNYPQPQYNGYGNYPPPQYNGYGEYPPPVRSTAPQKNNGLAIAGMVTALANLLMFKSLLSFITVPVALILTIIAIRRKIGNKVMYIISIAASVISSLIFAAYVYYAVNLWPEIKYFSNHSTEIMDEYEQTGRIPERFEKFNGSEYKLLWRMLGIKDLDELFEYLADEYDDSKSKRPAASKPSKEGTTSAADDEEPYDYEHSGEDIVVLGEKKAESL